MVADKKNNNSIYRETTDQQKSEKQSGNFNFCSSATIKHLSERLKLMLPVLMTKDGADNR